jgi:putative solute:sodium symporter small subunit
VQTCKTVGKYGSEAEGQRQQQRSSAAPLVHRRTALGARAAQARERAMPDSTGKAHWNRTTNLMLIHLGIWIFFSFIIHMFVVPLNKITIPVLGFPLGFYMAAQGSLIVFVVMLFFFAKQQDKVDREFGVAED